MPNLKLRLVELWQRAENGGHPLPNQLAVQRNMGHGTPLVVLPQRQFVAFLRYIDSVTQVGATTERDELREQLAGLLERLDMFVEPVKPSEVLE